MTLDETTAFGNGPAYRVQASNEVADAEWDDFVVRLQWGHHVQTSLWSQIKSDTGWMPHRILVADDAGIVAGAQMLTRRLPLGRAIGYVPKGPLLAADDPDLASLVIGQIKQLARDQKVAHLTVQPPNAGPDIAARLEAAGFIATDAEVAPRATVQIDLTQNEDTLLANMKKNHRRYIRHGLRQGMLGRHGTRADLPTFHTLLSATAHRQGFSPYPLSYFEKAWDILAPGDHIQLFIVEYQGEPVSAQVIFGFNDTVVAKNSGWSGNHSSLGPNHVLEWTTMAWAKAAGYRIYDLEGIDAAAGEILAAGGSLPENMRQRPFFWKLGFGGSAVVFPQAYVHMANPFLRKAYFSLYPRAAKWPLTAKLVARIRTG